MVNRKYLKYFKGVLYLILKYKFDGLSNEKIAEQLSISERTVLSQISIIRKVLKQNNIDVNTVLPRPIKYKIQKDEQEINTDLEKQKQIAIKTYEYWKKYDFVGRIKTLEIINIEKTLGL